MKHLSKRFASIALIVMALAGCASGYKDFYRPVNGTTLESIASRRIAPPPAMPAIEHSHPEKGDVIRSAYIKRGYVIIGQSLFNSGRRESEDAAVRQGQTVGADLVLIISPQYTGSVTTNLPLTTPTSSTAYSSGSATIVGAGRPLTAYGNSTTTTYGTATTYVPITVNRSDYAALFFVKVKMGLGISGRALNDAERQDLQTNKGIVVQEVIDGSAAFNADVLVGDVITTIDGQIVTTLDNFTSRISELSGRTITLTIVRRGQFIDKVVTLAS